MECRTTFGSEAAVSFFGRGFGVYGIGALSSLVVSGAWEVLGALCISDFDNRAQLPIAALVNACASILSVGVISLLCTCILMALVWVST